LKLDEDMAQLWPRVERHAESYCALMCDVDFFKQYNDTFGHLAGDSVLREVSGAFRSVLRAGDQLYRFGGEEFLIILHNCSHAGGATCAEQFRGAVEDLNIPHSGSPLGKVTVSIGMSCLGPSSSMTLQAWLQDADAAMYEAKGSGRNAVVTAQKLAA
jgi:diguanylate cyclase (GGDEF)-like protein